MNNSDPNDPTWFVMFGLFLGIFLTMALYESLPTSPVVIAFTAITLCERDIPRTQRCIITAIPEEK